MPDLNRDAVTAGAQAIYPLRPGLHVSGNEMLHCEDVARRVLEAAGPLIVAAERERTRPLLRALHDLYQAITHLDSFTNLTYDELEAIDMADDVVGDLLADGAFADLLDGET